MIQLDIGTNRNKESWKQSVRGDPAVRKHWNKTGIRKVGNSQG